MKTTLRLVWVLAANGFVVWLTITRLSPELFSRNSQDFEVWLEFILEMLLPILGIVLELARWKFAKWVNIGYLSLAGCFWLAEAVWWRSDPFFAVLLIMSFGLFTSSRRFKPDAYVMMALSSGTGASTLVTENIRWEGNHYELSNHVYDASTSKSLGQFAAKVTPSISGDDPFVFQDRESGASLIIPKRKTSGFHVFRYPQCEKCPPPVYLSAGAKGIVQIVYLRATITEQGADHQTAVMGTPNNGAGEASVAAVSGWRFKPEIDSRGK